MKKYKIANHLTGTLFFGASVANLCENEALFYSFFEVSPGPWPGNGFKPEYQLRDQTFYVLEQNHGAYFLENVETGIKFWVGGTDSFSFAKNCLELIPSE